MIYKVPKGSFLREGMRLLNFSSTLKFCTAGNKHSVLPSVLDEFPHKERTSRLNTRTQLWLVLLLESSLLTPPQLTLPIMAFLSTLHSKKRLAFPDSYCCSLVSRELMLLSAEHCSLPNCPNERGLTTSPLSNVSSELWVFLGDQHIF